MNETAPLVAGVGWSLTNAEGEPAADIDEARQIAASLGGVIVPTGTDHPDPRLALWLCDTDPGVYATLVEVGWVGLTSDEGDAEAEWVD